MFKIDIKQLQGVNEAIEAAKYTGNPVVGFGMPDLTGSVLKIPVEYQDGTTSYIEKDIASAFTDVNVANAILDPNSYKLTVTETDGTAHEVDLKSVLDQYKSEYIQPVLDELRTDVDAAQTAADAAQASADSALSAAQSAQTTANEAKTAVTQAQSDISALQTSQATLDGKITALETSQGVQDGKITALETSQVEQNNRLDALEALKITGVDVVLASGKATVADGDLASDLVVPAGVKHVIGVSVNGQSVPFGAKTQACYFSQDGGATAVMSGFVGAKLYWNGSFADYSIATGDTIVFTVLK